MFANASFSPRSKTRKNDLYDPDKLRKDVQTIYGLGNFEDVSLESRTSQRRDRYI